MMRPDEVPTLELPREDMMRIGMAFRAAAGLLRVIREREGRSAFSDAEHAARREKITRANEIAPMNWDDRHEWNKAKQDGTVITDRHDSGMVVQVVPLSGGRYGVTAQMGDTHTETVVGHRGMADELQTWLRNNSTDAAIRDLDATVRELKELKEVEKIPFGRPGLSRADFDDAYEWMNRPEQSEQRAKWDNTSTWMDEHNFFQDRDRAEWLIKEWKEAMGFPTSAAGPEERARREEEIWQWRQNRDTPADDATLDRLSDRLRGRVSDSILNHPRWGVADEQFAKLVEHGADPDLLADTVAGIRFHDGIRSPAGFAAWAMRDAVKRGTADTGTQMTEDQAKREVADEWLAETDPTSPLDRARAAQLVGQIDDQFDARLADRYPGLLDGDRLRERANARADQHEANARRADDAAAQHEATAHDPAVGRRLRRDDGHEGDTVTEDDWGDEETYDRRSAATTDAAYDRAHAADERSRAQQDRTTAETEAVQPTEAAQKAAQPLTRPANAPKPTKKAPSTPKSAPNTQDLVNRRRL